MILINKKLFFTKLQMIEFISNTLNLFIKKKKPNKNIHSYKGKDKTKNYDNLIISENLTKEIFSKEKLNDKNFLTIQNLENYFYSEINEQTENKNYENFPTESIFANGESFHNKCLCESKFTTSTKDNLYNPDDLNNNNQPHENFSSKNNESFSNFNPKQINQGKNLVNNFSKSKILEKKISLQLEAIQEISNILLDEYLKIKQYFNFPKINLKTLYSILESYSLAGQLNNNQFISAIKKIYKIDLLNQINKNKNNTFNIINNEDENNINYSNDLFEKSDSLPNIANLNNTNTNIINLINSNNIQSSNNKIFSQEELISYNISTSKDDFIKDIKESNDLPNFLSPFKNNGNISDFNENILNSNNKNLVFLNMKINSNKKFNSNLNLQWENLSLGGPAENNKTNIINTNNIFNNTNISNNPNENNANNNLNQNNKMNKNLLNNFNGKNKINKKTSILNIDTSEKISILLKYFKLFLNEDYLFDFNSVFSVMSLLFEDSLEERFIFTLKIFENENKINFLNLINNIFDSFHFILYFSKELDKNETKKYPINYNHKNLYYRDNSFISSNNSQNNVKNSENSNKFLKNENFNKNKFDKKSTLIESEYDLTKNNILNKFLSKKEELYDVCKFIVEEIYKFNSLSLEESLDLNDLVNYFKSC